MIVFFVFWIIIQFMVGYHLILPLLLYPFYLFNKKKEKEVTMENIENDYAIIVTAYQQTTLLPEVIDAILKLNYSSFLVYIVADNCDISNLHIDDERIILLKPENVLKSNVKSHFYAINNFKRDHQFLTIVDSDNLVDAEYLNELNRFFYKGYLAVQGVREAKNLNSTYACLDAASDIYYRFIDRELLYGLGSSAALSGSGMAFTTQLYKDCLENKMVEGAGFDKVLQVQIQKRNLKVAFAKKAIIYDGKTSKADQLVKQRARWINTWFKYAGLGYNLITLGLKNKSWNQFIYGIFFSRPPLFILLLLSLIFLVINLFIYPWMSIIWFAIIMSFFVCFFIALHCFNTPLIIYRSLFNIPVFMYYQIVSLLKSKKANEISVATVHPHDLKSK